MIQTFLGKQYNDSEYLLSQYEDDSFLILDDSSPSLECTLKLFEKFIECAGLKANIDKTEAIWIGAKRVVGISYCQRKI